MNTITTKIECETVNVVYDIDDDDLSYKVYFKGVDISGLLTESQLDSIDALCREEVYCNFLDSKTDNAISLLESHHE